MADIVQWFYLDNVQTRAVLCPTTNADSYEIVAIFLQTNSAWHCRYTTVEENKLLFWTDI